MRIMKRNTLLVVVAVALATQLYAQKRVSPGIRAGVNLASLSNINADFKTDFYAGGILGINLGQRYTLQPELIYSRQGANNVLFSGEETGEPDRTENVTIQYLSLGVMN